MASTKLRGFACTLPLRTLIAACGDGSPVPVETDGGAEGDAVTVTDVPATVADGALDHGDRDRWGDEAADVRAEGGTADPDAGVAAARSFVVSGRLQHRPRPPVANVIYAPDHHDFTLRLDPKVGTIVVGTRGTAVKARVTTSDGRVFTATAAIEAAPALTAPATKHVLPDGGGTVYLGAVTTLELPLPAGAEGEVVVDLAVGPEPGACALLPPTAGYLIDDLRAE